MGTTIGSEAAIPNPALRPLSFLIGEWRTEGSHPLLPGKTLRGRTSFAWSDGGAFLVMRSEIDEPEVPSGIAIFGTDDDAKECSMLFTSTCPLSLWRQRLAEFWAQPHCRARILLSL